MHAPFTEVLVPLDGSEAAERAMGPAVELVTRTGVPLRVVSRALPGEEEACAEYLAGVADRFAAATDVEAQAVSGEAIVEAVRGATVPGSLVCMSSHGRGGLSRAIMGSVAEELLRTLPEPVLVVGPHLVEGAWFAGRVVACLDGSDESMRVLDPARQWSQALGLPLWLMEVADPALPADWTTHGDVYESGHLAAVASRVGGIEGWDVLHDRDPAHGLVDMAASEAQPTALLVMATHGRTGWDRLRLGSVTAATVQRSPVPVLVVPAAPGEAPPPGD